MKNFFNRVLAFSLVGAIIMSIFSFGLSANALASEISMLSPDNTQWKGVWDYNWTTVVDAQTAGMTGKMASFKYWDPHFEDQYSITNSSDWIDTSTLGQNAALSFWIFVSDISKVDYFRVAFYNNAGVGENGNYTYEVIANGADPYGIKSGLIAGWNKIVLRLDTPSKYSSSNTFIAGQTHNKISNFNFKINTNQADTTCDIYDIKFITTTQTNAIKVAETKTVNIQLADSVSVIDNQATLNGLTPVATAPNTHSDKSSVRLPVGFWQQISNNIGITGTTFQTGQKRENLSLEFWIYTKNPITPASGDSNLGFALFDGSDTGMNWVNSYSVWLNTDEANPLKEGWNKISINFNYGSVQGNIINSKSFKLYLSNNNFAENIYMHDTKLVSKPNQSKHFALEQRDLENALLVAMNGSGTVEMFRESDGKHLTTLIKGLNAPNDVKIGPDDNLYVSYGTGANGGIKKFDKNNGRLISDIKTFNTRVTGIEFYKGDIFVSLCDLGEIRRLDGTTYADKGLFATLPVGGITEIEVSSDRLISSNYNGGKVVVFNADTGAIINDTLISDRSFGIATNKDGSIIYATNALNTIEQFLNYNKSVLVSASQGLNTPVYMTLGSDENLYVTNILSNTISAWNSKVVNTKILEITDPSIVSPTGITATMVKTEADRTMPIGNWVDNGIRNVGSDWTITGNTNVLMNVYPTKASIPFMGWDTEGGDRARTNILKEPITIKFKTSSGWIDSSTLQTNVTATQNSVKYDLTPIPNTNISWTITVTPSTGNIDMKVEGSGTGLNNILDIEVFMPFDPSTTGTNIIAENWQLDGGVKAPLIINALDLGQMVVKSQDDANGILNCRFTGSRDKMRTDFFVGIGAQTGTFTKNINIAPVHLVKPVGVDNTRWEQSRRGLFSLIELNCAYESNYGAVAGVIGNNVLSIPVSVMMDKNFDWVKGLGDGAQVAPGINLNIVMRKTLEHWMDNQTGDNGLVNYITDGQNVMSDANPQILSVGWDYITNTNDLQWAQTYINKFELIAKYMESRDIDNDGLIESILSGTGTREFGDTGYDTVSSGGKNAYSNAISYRAFLSLADIEKKLGRTDKANHYTQFALKLKKAFNEKLYNPTTGWYKWWIDYSGQSHDYAAMIANSNAIQWGLADDTRANSIMNNLWNKMAEVGFNNFSAGIPTNLLSVPANYNFSNYGDQPFPYYCNGGIFTQDGITTAMAFKAAGLQSQYETVAYSMLSRQHKGILENGAGFQQGIRTKIGAGFSISKWDGTPCDYEGVISRDNSFLSAVLFEVPEISDKLYSAINAAKGMTYDGSLETVNSTIVTGDFQLDSCDKPYTGNNWLTFYLGANKDNKIEGEAAASIYHAGPVCSVMFQFDPISLNKDLSNYELSFWVYNDVIDQTMVNGSQFELNSSGMIDDNNEISWEIPKAEFKIGWSKITLNFADATGIKGNVNVNELKFARFYLAATPGRGAYTMLDDIRIINKSVDQISSEKAITSFNFTNPAVTGQINEVSKTIALTVPFGTNVTALVPNIAVSALATVSPSTGVAQNFTSPVIYTVTAQNGTTAQYTVTVTKSPDTRSSAKAITSFNFTNPAVTGQINEANKTISLTVPFGTNVTALVPNIAVSEVATVSPSTGVAQNFTAPVIYTVTAENGTTAQYTVTVTISPDTRSSAKAITSFNFTSPVATGEINNTNKTIVLTVPFGTSITSFVPTIVVSENATVSPNSGVSQNFTNPVVYTVTAQNGTTAQYTVTVIVSADTRSNEKTITSFVFANPSVTGQIDNASKTITLTVPFGTNITSLIPTIVISDRASISPSLTTPQNFTNPVSYTVTAQNGTTAQYIVRVTVASAPAPNNTITKLLDTQTNITVEGIEFSSDLKLLIEKQSGDSILNAKRSIVKISAGVDVLGLYDISLRNLANTIVQPNGEVTVSIPVPSNYVGSGLQIYSINGENAEVITSKIKDGMIIFKVSQFSKYAIVKVATKVETNVKTGNSTKAMAFPMLLISTFIVMIMFRRKKGFFN